MDPFTPVKFDNGKMAYNGTVRSEEFGDVHEFWIKLSNRKNYMVLLSKYTTIASIFAYIYMSLGLRQKN